MKTARILLLVLATAAVSACSNPQMASRNAVDATGLTQPSLTQPKGQSAEATAQKIFGSDMNIAKVTVDVPRKLSVSEENSYLPKSDIVWRGDVYGDRHSQITAIVETAAARTASTLTGKRPVHMHIEVTRFHGVTEKARYRVGGVHNMNFAITLLDPNTGAILRPTKHVVSNLDALKGDEALAGDRAGQTQKVRVIGFLTNVLQAELTQPAGYQEPRGGLMVLLNRK